MINTEILDKISDEFQSTFSFMEPDMLYNLFSPNEVERVREIITSNIPGALCYFQKQERIDVSVYVYAIRIVLPAEPEPPKDYFY
jgi:hypothetical protein